jgi:hypothetical protein
MMELRYSNAGIKWHMLLAEKRAELNFHRKNLSGLSGRTAPRPGITLKSQ